MKNTAINALQYTGIVTLSQYIGSKKIQIAQAHNTGSISLFDFLADCLVGEELATIRTARPAKIKLVRWDPDDSSRYESASGFISLTTQPQKKVITDGTAGRKVTYSFMVHRDQFETVTDLEHLGIGLYASSAENKEDASNFMAFCKLTFSRSVATSATLVVDWDLILTNADTTKETN